MIRGKQWSEVKELHLKMDLSTTPSITNEHLHITYPHTQLFGKLKSNNFNIEVMGGNRKKQEQALQSLLREEPCWPFHSLCIPPGSL